MEQFDIQEFISKVEESPANTGLKETFKRFANEAMCDNRKADALGLFVSNFTAEGNLDPEIWNLQDNAITDFYQDYIGNGSDTVLMNDTI